MKPTLLIVLLLLAAMLLVVLFPGGVAPQSDLDRQLNAVIAAHDLTGDPSIGRNLPHIDDPLPQLGKKLFYTKALGGEGDSACVTCHHPMLGGGDALPLSIGVGAHVPELLGPGRTHPEGPLVPRNAPTTFNIGMWDQFLFHDGRVESMGKTPGKSGNDGYGIRTPDRPWGYPDPDAGSTLAVAQSRFPVTSEEEMRGFDFGMDEGNSLTVVDDRSRGLLAAIIGNYGDGEGALANNAWRTEFEQAFGSNLPVEAMITFDNIAEALGAYENSQIFVDTPWRAYVQGDVTALDESAKRGAALFYGEAGCATCHSGDFFTNEQFYTLAIPQFGMGRDSGIYGDDDFGRYLETGRDEDKYAFRTPTLLNVAATAPYGHSGAYSTLEEIIRHHLNPAAAIDAYNFDAIDPQIRTTNSESYTRHALDKLLADRQAGRTTVRDIDLSDDQVADLVSFMHALTDPCVTDRACLAPWIPEPDETDPDGLRLIAIDETGNPL